MKLRLDGAYYHGHRPGCAPWEPGEEREVPAETADYLLSTFGDRFAAVDPPKAEPARTAAIEAPPLDRMISTPQKARHGGR